MQTKRPHKSQNTTTSQTGRTVERVVLVPLRAHRYPPEEKRICFVTHKIVIIMRTFFCMNWRTGNHLLGAKYAHCGNCTTKLSLPVSGVIRTRRVHMEGIS